jgi:pyruvyltransferase
MIKVNWHKSQNFGDQLNPYILKRLWDLESEYAGENDRETPHLMLLGSILNESNNYTTVLGAGIVSDTLEFSPGANYVSVRGNLTKNRISEMGVDVSNILVGDPGIILPKIYAPLKEKKYAVTIAPHWVDYAKALNFLPDYNVLSLKMPSSDFFTKNLSIEDQKTISKQFEERYIEFLIDEISQSKVVVCSSLHALVIAHAYGVRTIWAKFSDNIIGDGYKFRDYFSAHTANYDSIECLDFSSSVFSEDEIKERSFELDVSREADIIYESLRNYKEKLTEDFFI